MRIGCCLRACTRTAMMVPMASTSRSLIFQFLRQPPSCRFSLLRPLDPKHTHRSYSSLLAPTTNNTLASASLSLPRPSQAPSHLFFTPTPSPRSRLGWYRDRESASTSHSSHSRRPGTGRSSSGGSGSGFYYGQGPGSSRGNPFALLRRLFNRLPGDLIVWGIIGANGAVFLLWQLAADRLVSASGSGNKVRG